MNFSLIANEMKQNTPPHDYVMIKRMGICSFKTQDKDKQHCQLGNRQFMSKANDEYCDLIVT